MVKDSNIAKRNFVWIVTDASAAAATEFTGDVISGMWGIFPPSEPITTLDNYFSKLTASTNKRNPWYISDYEEVFKCTNGINCSNSSITSVDGYVQFPYVSNVIDAVYSLAHAIHSFVQNSCQQPVVWISSNQTFVGQTKKFNGQNLRDYLRSVNFTSPTGSMYLLMETSKVLIRLKTIRLIMTAQPIN